MNWIPMLLVFCLGALVGALLAWRTARAQNRLELEAARALATEGPRLELATLGERLRAAQADLAQERALGAGVRETLDGARAELAGVRQDLTRVHTEQQAERAAAAEKIALLQEAREALTDQFKTLASDILEEKSKRFAEQNQTSLSQLLSPLGTRLAEFKARVEEVYVQEGKDRSALAEQVRMLSELNKQLGVEASNLTKALKGSTKTQGNWGELILERVLEAAGLRRGHEYVVQDSQTREDGSRAQPDVVIHLPEDRRLVVDAKVSLVHYEQFMSADTEGVREAALRQHLASVRTHIRGLSDRRYQDLYGLKSLDFVLAFVPIEPAFMLAVTHDNDLFRDAWERNVLLVSPSTLLFVVRTVAHLWRQEAQSRNAQDIARRGAELYDKLAGFVEDLEDVGKRLAQAQKSFESARGKFSEGRGNLIRQAEMLRELGVKPTKALPATMVQAALEDEPRAPDAAKTDFPPISRSSE